MSYRDLSWGEREEYAQDYLSTFGPQDLEDEEFFALLEEFDYEDESFIEWVNEEEQRLEETHRENFAYDNACNK